MPDRRGRTPATGNARTTEERADVTRGIVVAAGATASLAVLAPSSHALIGPGTISVTDLSTQQGHIDLGRRGTSIGDIDVYKVALYNKRITPRPIGRGEMVCTATGTHSQNCSATYFLPRGELVAEGAIGSRLIYELAVVGGTRLYSGVRGTLTVTSLKRKPARELLVFRLVA
jgi:hypothetical protein